MVLINGNTASTAEFLAAALRDNSAAQLVGEHSFGKVLSCCPVLLAAVLCPWLAHIKCFDSDCTLSEISFSSVVT